MATTTQKDSQMDTETPNWHEYSPDEIQALSDRGESPKGFEGYVLIKYDRGYQYAVRRLREDEPLDLKAIVEDWIQHRYGGMMELDEPLTRLAGTPNEATIYLEGQEPFASYCWTGRGFYMQER